MLHHVYLKVAHLYRNKGTDGRGNDRTNFLINVKHANYFLLKFHFNLSISKIFDKQFLPSNELFVKVVFRYGLPFVTRNMNRNRNHGVFFQRFGCLRDNYCSRFSYLQP